MTLSTTQTEPRARNAQNGDSMYDYFDHKVHECGCETRFNCLLWTSETLRQCDEHRLIVEACTSVVARLSGEGEGT